MFITQICPQASEGGFSDDISLESYASIYIQPLFSLLANEDTEVLWMKLTLPLILWLYLSVGASICHTLPAPPHTHKWYVSSTRALTVVLLTILSAYHPNSLSKGICQMRKWIKVSSMYCQTNQSSVLLWKNKTEIKKNYTKSLC